MTKRRMPNRSIMGNGLYWESMSHWERGLLEWALEIGKGNYEFTARVLGITKGHVYNRCRTLGIDVSKFLPPKKQPILQPEPEPPEPEPPVAEATETAQEPEEDEDAPDTDPDVQGGDDADEPGADDFEGDADDADDDASDENDAEDTEAAAEDEDDERCLCGAKLVTFEERQKWIQCQNCRNEWLAEKAARAAKAKEKTG